MPALLRFFIFLIVLIFARNIYGSCDATADCPTCRFEDWVDDPICHPLCKGYYQEAPLPRLPANTPAGATLITSEHGEFIHEGVSTLSGKVHLVQGSRQIYADSAKIYRDPRTHKVKLIEAEGNLKLLEPGLRLEGSHGSLNLTEDTKDIYNSCYRIYPKHGRGEASHIHVQGQNCMTLRDATYTTCAPCQYTWQLKAREVKLNKIRGRGQAKHARLYINKIPVFYSPYISFPIDDRRQTGFLTPTYAKTASSGLELAAPYYLNLAPNYDATLTPRYLSKRGVEGQGLFRYLTPLNQGLLQGAYLPNDRAYKIFRREASQNHPGIANTDPRVTHLTRGNNARKMIFFKDNSCWTENWASRVYYQKVGDDNYFIDLSNTLGNSDTVNLLQEGQLLYQEQHFTGLLRVQNYQTLHPFAGPVVTDPYQRYPQFYFLNTYYDLPGCLQWEMPGEFTHFAHRPDPFTGLSLTTGNRYYLKPGLSLPILYPGWYIKPRVQLYFLAYDVRLGELNRRLPPRHFGHRIHRNTSSCHAHPHIEVPMFDLDSGLIFDRNICAFNQNYIQTLEPRAYYLFVPYRNQNALPIFDTAEFGFDYNFLYRDNRFSGLDRIGDANQLTLGLTSRFLKTNSGQEKLYLSAGQIFYFTKRKVFLDDRNINPLTSFSLAPWRRFRNEPFSALAAVANYHLQEDLTALASLEWDPSRKQTDKEGFFIQYRPEPLNVVNLGYQFLRRNPARINPRTGRLERLDQIDGSFAWALTEQWRVLGRVQYDLRFKHTLQVLAGIEQQGCCTAIRLSYFRYLLPNDGINNQNGLRRHNSGILLQFVLKGFAGIGHSMTNVISQAIPGYEWRGEDF